MADDELFDVDLRGDDLQKARAREYAARQKEQRRAMRLAALPKDRKCPGCDRIVLNPLSWIVLAVAIRRKSGSPKGDTEKAKALREKLDGAMSCCRKCFSGLENGEGGMD
jgi:hypothetical protein